MNVRVFVSQNTIDNWVLTDQVELAGDVVSIKPSNIRLQLRAASYFRSVAGGSMDTQDIIGRVKDEAEITELGGEAYMSSVVIGEAAYDIEPGFVAIPVGQEDGRTVLAALSLMRH